ncbi:hypothetical protein BDV96DRAFT_563525 [Lophiotrema nucula]|uniref:Uncharacterized protein n=1 Tax=Lophiotrema nucula TaxID=690887 RepID=A0A6A5ZS51_9PLEO|nr:hypothetical protein BDV96DRAFT_563525 [Lophiotrema nucula]
MQRGSLQRFAASSLPDSNIQRMGLFAACQLRLHIDFIYAAARCRPSIVLQQYSPAPHHRVPLHGTLLSDVNALVLPELLSSLPNEDGLVQPGNVALSHAARGCTCLLPTVTGFVRLPSLSTYHSMAHCFHYQSQVHVFAYSPRNDNPANGIGHCRYVLPNCVHLPACLPSGDTLFTQHLDIADGPTECQMC